MAKKVKLGFVGCGRMGRLHMGNIVSAIPEAEIVAVSDPMMDKTGGREWCAAHGITNVFTDEANVINNPDGLHDNPPALSHVACGGQGREAYVL